MQIPHPCRARRRQEPCKNLAIITMRPRIGLVRVVNYSPCQPHAGATATPEKKLQNRAKGPYAAPRGCPEVPPAPTLIHCKSYYYSSISPLQPDPTRTTRRAPTRGAADFPCLRQLPPPPELQCGHERRRRDLGRRERRGRHMCAEDAHAEYAHMCMSADDAR